MPFVTIQWHDNDESFNETNDRILDHSPKNLCIGNDDSPKYWIPRSNIDLIQLLNSWHPSLM